MGNRGTFVSVIVGILIIGSLSFVGQNSAHAGGAVVDDFTPPNIFCPADLLLTAPADTNPTNTGFATTTDDTDPNPEITWTDTVITTPDEEVTTRTWTSTDESGNSASCVQVITVNPQPVDIDIKPGSDPNSVNTNTKGVLPVAILGSEDFDATQIDQSSIIGVTTSADFIFDVWFATPLRCSVEDVNDDGILDLNCKFLKKDLMLDCWTNGLEVSGWLLDGTTFFGSDTIRPIPCDEDF